MKAVPEQQERKESKSNEFGGNLFQSKSVRKRERK